MVPNPKTYDHCASYSTIEELYTELTFEATKEKRLTPNGVSLNPANNIAVAFDNYVLIC